jgi:hypothetical protein
MTSHRQPPTFTVYPQFAKDWDRFSAEEKEVVGDFLETLQEEYDNPVFQQGWELNGKYWGAILPTIGFRVIWVLEYPSHLGVVPTQPARNINILMCEPIPE